jgi:hypothetical protein
VVRTGYYSPEDGILHSDRRENLRCYRALTGWDLWRRCILSPVRYELVFDIPEDGILQSHRRENLKSYNEISPLWRLGPSSKGSVMTADTKVRGTWNGDSVPYKTIPFLGTDVPSRDDHKRRTLLVIPRG